MCATAVGKTSMYIATTVDADIYCLSASPRLYRVQCVHYTDVMTMIALIITLGEIMW